VPNSVAGPSQGSRKKDRTRAEVLKAALGLFRKRGFDDTSMRDIAAEAGLSLGAAYYHFASKQAIVLAYYHELQDAYEAEVPFDPRASLEERLRAVMNRRLDLVKRDRGFLGALVRDVGSPDNPVMVFAPQTADLRARSIASFAASVAPELAVLPEAAARLLPTALWALHLVTLLYFIHDRSRGQARTRRLVDDSVALVVPAIMLAGSPLAGPLLSSVEETLRRAALI